MKNIEVPDHLYPALERMISVLAKKRQDYAGKDAWANFKATADHFGFPIWESADFNEIQKLSRIKTLRGVPDPANESVEDSYLDKANFALLAYAMYLDQNRPVCPDSDTERIIIPHGGSSGLASNR